MVYSKRGISLVTVSTSVVILILLLSTVSISITYSANNAKKMTFAKEIYNIQSMVTEYIQKENVIPASETTIKIKPSNLEQFEGETLDSGELLLNVLDLTELEIRNTNYGNKEIGTNDSEKEKDVYAISQTTGKVYYIAGFKTGEKTYYTLTDELLNIIEKKQQLTIGENTILFVPDKLGWSKEAISVKVAVPSDYTVDSITIDNTNISYTTETIDNVTYYNVNTAKVAANYTITVKYTKNGTSGTASYTTKFDNTAPTISKDSSIANTNTHVKGIKSEDTQSGIKTFKYVEGNIENDANISEYMNTYGKKIRKGIVNFVNKTVYTLYAEDRAGNYKVMYINTNKNLVASIPKPPTLAPMANLTVTLWYYDDAGTQHILGYSNDFYVTSLKFVDSYSPGPYDKPLMIGDNKIVNGVYGYYEEPLPMAVDKDGNKTTDIRGYYNKQNSQIVIVGNGSGKIKLKNAANLFSSDAHDFTIYFLYGLDMLDTSECTTMERMFYGTSLSQKFSVPSTWDTSKVTNIYKMFGGSASQYSLFYNQSTLDLSNFDASSVTSTFDGFCSRHSNNLTTIYLNESLCQAFQRVGTIGGAFYTNKTVTSSNGAQQVVYVATTVYGANAYMKNSYQWTSSDRRTVTFAN